MGMIQITTSGSFPTREKVFGPADEGHAILVAEAIEYLVTEVLPEAIGRDHRLHSQGNEPPKGWPSGWPI